MRSSTPSFVARFARSLGGGGAWFAAAVRLIGERLDCVVDTNRIPAGRNVSDAFHREEPGVGDLFLQAEGARS